MRFEVTIHIDAESVEDAEAIIKDKLAPTNPDVLSGPIEVEESDPDEGVDEDEDEDDK